MHRPEFSGQEAIEFILISALVFFAAIFSFIVLGDKLSEFFMKDSAAVKVANQKAPAITASQTQKYSFSHDLNTGVSDAPLYSAPERATKKIDYEGDTFTLDFGDLKLTNIPADFNTYVIASGSSGASEFIGDAILQVAKHLEESGLPAESTDKVKKLANLGHQIASYEKTFEDKVKNCNKDNKCLKSVEKSLERNLLNIGEAQRDYKNNKREFNKNVNEGNTAYLFVYELNKVLNDPEISQTDINVIKELAWNIGVIAEDFQNNLAGLAGSRGNRFYDPITGKSSSEKIQGDTYENFVNYNASKITNFDSALICAAGKHTDTGKKCH